jgi:hypothetical protein
MSVASRRLPATGGMEFEVTENGQGVRLGDDRLVRVKGMPEPGMGVRTITIISTVDDSSISTLKCDKSHVSGSLTVGLEGFGSFMAGVFSGQLPYRVMSCRELVIAAWNNRLLGRWLC